MSSTIVLTDEIRKIPYFSSFSEDEKEVVVPREYINESINYDKEVERIGDCTLVTIIENRVYLGLDNDQLIRELLWRLGELEVTMKHISSMSPIIQAELKPYLSHPDCNYVYGIRCRIKLDNNCPCSNAALVGNLRLLKWLVDNKFMYDRTKENWVCEKAALNGHLEVLKWAIENRFWWNSHTVRNASKNGHLECLKYAIENDCMPDMLFDGILAARYGHLECLKYLHKKGAYIHFEDIALEAVRYGHINILEYSGEYRDCFWELEKLSYEAALNGHLHILKYLYENGCSWNEKTCSNAAYNGHLDCLKYARENGCPWNKETYENALLNKHYDVVQYALDNDCPR